MTFVLSPGRLRAPIQTGKRKGGPDALMTPGPPVEKRRERKGKNEKTCSCSLILSVRYELGKDKL